jgi:hypothetical protein
MNNLELCQALRLEAGVSGTDTSVVGATGEWGQVVHWIKQAWRDIQMKHDDWNFMRADASFVTVADQMEYDYDGAEIALTNFSRWKKNSFRIYSTTVADQHFLAHLDYERFRDTYIYGSYQETSSYPSAIAVTPTDSLVLGLRPDTTYTVTGQYYKNVQSMTLDADEPDMPERFHMLIVWKALMRYGRFEESGTIMQIAEREYNSLLFALEGDELPRITRK